MSTADLLDPASYPADPPGGDCDLIMKGGITSGVVYPRAACTLAQTRRFRSIGGASAGAIAAAAVAAAEYARSDKGFVRLAGLPDELGSTLAGLFQPGESTRRPFRLLAGFLEPGRSGLHRARTAATQIAAGAPVAFGLTLVALLGVPLLALGVTATGSARSWVGFVVAALVWVPAGLVLALALAALVFARDSLSAMGANGFGLCDGHQRDPATTEIPLTDWMAETFNRLAGMPVDGRPLTFGDLWGADAVARQRDITERDRSRTRVSTQERVAAAAARQVDLVVMTTSLTFGRPYQFPFASNQFLFCPDHMATYFPPNVVGQLTAAAPAELPQYTDTVDGVARPIPTTCPDHGTPLMHLPQPWDIPVVVAARLSLSFPGLISAVPFFTVDWTRRPGLRGIIPVWFSDGGISSNFPMHFFDSAFPSRPTFGINLSPMNRDYPDQLVWKPSQEGRPGPPEATQLSGMLSFGHSILDTMQNWVDNTQITMPGYRDRIVTVRQRPQEGGLNLMMPADTITALANRGAQAADLLSTFDLDLHRWIRYRVAMAGADDLLTGLNGKYQNGFREFIDRYGPITTHFPLGSASATDADRAATAALMSLAAQWQAAGDPATRGSVPRPKPDLRFVPRQ